jgi:hypothetical protein
MTIETDNAGPPRVEGSGLVERAKRIILQPKVEWERIDVEPASVGEIFRDWVLILAAIPALAGLIGALVFGYSFLGVTYRPSIIEALGSAITQYVLTVAGVFVLALIIDALAPKFGGAQNRVQARKSPLTRQPPPGWPGSSRWCRRWRCSASSASTASICSIWGCRA